MRIGVVGAGVAGALLAWRLRQAAPRIAVHLYTATPRGADATGASGGLVRGFECAPDACRVAAASLAELRADPALRAAAAYQEIGSVYLLPPGVDPAGSVPVLDELLPGSATVLAGAELAARYPFRDLPAGTTAVAERRAGYLSPARLRDAVLDRLAAAGLTIRAMPVRAVLPDPALVLADGTSAGYDTVVIAAGAWTPGLLAASGLPAEGLTTKQIQYTVYPGRSPGLGAFVDDGTGLYGRPAADGLLLGLPSDRWGVDPAGVRPDPRLVRQVAETARYRLGLPAATDRPLRTVASFDCYHDRPGLMLRATGAGAAVLTFTGGSGGAAKTALAASRTAAGTLATLFSVAQWRIPVRSGWLAPW
ncbi:MAG TPA: FAD-dependent oxidoreductase [Actinophytocola sp.]|uniref:FAD-dependent oxidoreductase n=1 Tax=Actinophytocola sp. TaxID=1872138 RepID=UPI002DBB6447|nr:FAD-dependent oxidoreductase [Actinophytocola sp.]HEU5471315.1 FAD-dependent oxidoreductase [Actinophytocola sp.]